MLAISRTQCTAGLIVHSGQGWRDKMQPYRAIRPNRGVKQSRSRQGKGFDDAVIESFIGILKVKYFRVASPNVDDELKAGVHDAAGYYNLERIQLRFKGLSPVECRLRNTASVA